MNRRVLATFFAAVFGGRAFGQSAPASPCMLSGREQSALAWQSGAVKPGGHGLSGRVVRLGDLRPLPSIAVELEPGRFFTSTDSVGHFQFTGVPNGRYLIRFGYSELADSITLGADGLVVLAASAEHVDDLVISCKAPPASIRRPPNER